MTNRVILTSFVSYLCLLNKEANLVHSFHHKIRKLSLRYLTIIILIRSFNHFLQLLLLNLHAQFTSHLFEIRNTNGSSSSHVKQSE